MPLSPADSRDHSRVLLPPRCRLFTERLLEPGGVQAKLSLDAEDCIAFPLNASTGISYDG
jgi:hypothetical protein